MPLLSYQWRDYRQPLHFDIFHAQREILNNYFYQKALLNSKNNQHLQATELLLGHRFNFKSWQSDNR
jgi:hypothetical protein